jgi:predicted acylesterase/phospholipase RssA
VRGAKEFVSVGLQCSTDLAAVSSGVADPVGKSPRIVIDPDPPRLGEPAVLSVRLNGQLPDRGVAVEWTFMRRDDSESHWPHAEQGKASLSISAWSAEHHGTYGVRVGDTVAARTIPPALRVALSGGGYRATLFGLGALLYLVDVDAQHRVEDLASVSGGSILNAFVHDRCDLSTVTRDEFWRVGRDLTAGIMRSRILPNRDIDKLVRIAVALGLLLLTAGSISLAVAAFIVLGTWWGASLAVVVVLILIVGPMLRGLTVERLLRRRFGITASLDDRRRRVSHVFCATDLVEGEPFYLLATLGGGFFYSRRRGAARSNRYPVRKAVRASAAFPFAFLPKRVNLSKFEFHWSSDPTKPVKQYRDGRAFCADGGVANNLGTQWFEENDTSDWPYRLIFGSDLAGGVRWQPGRETIDIAVDASVPIEAASSSWFALPVVAELRSVTRVMRVLYENTLRPRRVEATWQESMLAEKGYLALVEEGVLQTYAGPRGTHRRIIVPLDRALLLSLENLTNADRRGFLPDNAARRFLEVESALEEAGIEAFDGQIGAIAAAERIPTTLFRLSRGQTASAILAGYLAAFVNCHTYEGTGSPANLSDAIERVRSLTP